MTRLDMVLERFSFADIPTVSMTEIKRQKPQSAARMSENTVPSLIAGLFMNNGVTPS